MFVYSTSITGKTNSDADQIIDVSDHYNQGPFLQHVADNWQGHFEPYLTATDAGHTPDAGTAAVYGVPKGATFSSSGHTDGNVDKGMMLLGTVDLTNADHSELMVEWSGVYDYLVIVPDSLDADCSYDFYVTAWA